ncbi:hypothetical protein C0J52_07338 [Blattella germanica]|nr:hypothetical protein C0J52_07338 [Blattella germanica]
MERTEKIWRPIECNNGRGMRHNNELVQLSGDLDVVTYIRIMRLKWLGHGKQNGGMESPLSCFYKPPRREKAKRKT